MADEKSKAPEVKHCVVCGAGSHREDWQKKDKPACDSHTKEEIADALKPKAPVKTEGK